MTCSLQVYINSVILAGSDITIYPIIKSPLFGDSRYLPAVFESQRQCIGFLLNQGRHICLSFDSQCHTYVSVYPLPIHLNNYQIFPAILQDSVNSQLIVKYQFYLKFRTNAEMTIDYMHIQLLVLKAILVEYASGHSTVT